MSDGPVFSTVERSESPAVAPHTPGPWTATMQKSKDGRDLGWIIDSPEGRIGWSSYANTKTNQGDTPPYEQSGINACLIASSPALLKVCKLALNAFENNWAIDWNEISAVIAKAEGRS